MQDKDDDVRSGATRALGTCYSHLPEAHRKPAWDDLIRLMQDKDDDVRSGATRALGTCYSDLPEAHRETAWDNLLRLTQDKNYYVQRDAARALGTCYSDLPEAHRETAWDDLHRLTQDKNFYVRSGAAQALGTCYSDLSEAYRIPAWDDLIRLMQDKDDDVRSGAARALGTCYSDLPEEYRKLAWDDLTRLTQDKNYYVQRGAARALGTCYSDLPEEYRKPAWNDLHTLTQDKDKNVRVAANHSSGRVSIYRANQAKSNESVRKELEAALRYFEKSSNEASYFNPAKFCLPIYRLFHAITFKKEEPEAEVKKYLAEAKKALGGSESKENLLEVIESLSNALKEVQKERDLDGIKTDLNTYMRYCDRACELLDTMEKKAPGASKLFRKGLPIIDKKIKETLKQIEERTKQFCQDSRQTPVLANGEIQLRTMY
jgi:HEAT repeat protein